MENILNEIKAHKPLNKDICSILDVRLDGNCFFRALSLYFSNYESHYKFFREQIYLAAKENLEIIKEFFYEDEKDPVLVNYKLDGYIKKIQ